LEVPLDWDMLLSDKFMAYMMCLNGFRLHSKAGDVYSQQH
jgi:hypothetical protein